MALAVPLYLLFELSVVVSHIAFRKRLKRKAEAEREMTGAGAMA
jgi:Sec-independent protein secretion pathway component TatC